MKDNFLKIALASSLLFCSVHVNASNHSSKGNLGSLPDEVILHILNKLDISSLVKTRSVATEFKALVDEEIKRTFCNKKFDTKEQNEIRALSNEVDEVDVYSNECQRSTDKQISTKIKEATTRLCFQNDTQGCLKGLYILASGTTDLSRCITIYNKILNTPSFKQEAIYPNIEEHVIQTLGHLKRQISEGKSEYKNISSEARSILENLK